MDSEKWFLLLVTFVCMFAKPTKAEHDQSMSPSGMYQTILSNTFGQDEINKRAQADGEFFDYYRKLSDIFSGENKLFRAVFESSTASNNRDNDCLNDMMGIYYSGTVLGQDWAKKYLDSNGAKPPGFMSLNVRWFGDFDQCLSIGPVTPDGETTILPQYCRLDLIQPGVAPTLHDTISPEPKGLTLGVCVTNRCHLEDMDPLVQQLVSLMKMDGFNVTVNRVMSNCVDENPPFTIMTYATIAVFSVIALFLLIGLAVDLVIKLRAWWNAEHSTTMEKLPLPSSPSSSSSVRSQLVQLALYFSPYANFLKVFTIQTPPAPNLVPNLNAINGIRAMSLFWVILGHTYIFLYLFLMDNIAVAMGEWARRISFMFLFSALYAVDTFLFLSGFLAYWGMIRQFKSLSVSGFFKQLPYIYFHRYVRLTAPFVALVLIDVGLWAHFSTGPFYFQGLDYKCATNWWGNLLYINNLIDTKNQCLPWSWYLAVDMQCFVLTPFVVYLFIRKPCLGWLSCIFAICIQIVAAATLTVVYKMPSIGTPPLVKQPWDDRNYEDGWDIIYIKPYTRLVPYVIGIMSAHLAIKHAEFLKRKIFPKLWLSGFMWVLTFGTLLTLIYAQHGLYVGDYVNSRAVDAFFNAVSRIAWGLPLGWLLLACIFNHAGPVGSFLEWPVWAIPARLGYAGYLVHPMVLNFYGQTSRRPINATDITMSFLFCATLIITLMVATLFTLAFEMPVVGLLRVITPSKSKNKPRSN